MSTGNSYYVWENKDPIPASEVIRVSGDQQCFITDENITKDADAYWTDEFDAWISSRGYHMIINAQSLGELQNNPEWEIIFAEWYAKDESISGRPNFYDPDNVGDFE